MLKTLNSTRTGLAGRFIFQKHCVSVAVQAITIVSASESCSAPSRTKRKVTETKKVSVNVKGESVTVIHPDGNRELVQEKPFTATSA